MKKLFSLEKLTQGIRLSLTKYPISILFAALAAMLLIVITKTEGNVMEDLTPYIIGCAMGISLFFAIHTALQNKTWPGYVKGLVMVMGLGILWLIVSDIKNQMDSGSDQSQAIQIFGYGLLTHLVLPSSPSSVISKSTPSGNTTNPFSFGPLQPFYTRVFYSPDSVALFWR